MDHTGHVTAPAVASAIMPAPSKEPPAMTPEAFRAWMKRCGFSLTTAAVAIGRRRATIVRYLRGPEEGIPIDRTVALACWAIERGAPRDRDPFTPTGVARPAEGGS